MNFKNKEPGVKETLVLKLAVSGNALRSPWAQLKALFHGAAWQKCLRSCRSGKSWAFFHSTDTRCEPAMVLGTLELEGLEFLSLKIFYLFRSKVEIMKLTSLGYFENQINSISSIYSCMYVSVIS